MTQRAWSLAGYLSGELAGQGAGGAVSQTPPLPVSVTAVEYWHSELQCSGTSWTGQIGGRVLPAVGTPVVQADGSNFAGRRVAHTSPGNVYRATAIASLATSGTFPWSMSIFRFRAIAGGGGEQGIIDYGVNGVSDDFYMLCRLDNMESRCRDQSQGPAADTSVHRLEVYNDTTQVVSRRDATVWNGGTAFGINHNLTSVGISVTASTAGAHQSTAAHAFHMICSAVPSAGELAALRAWATAYWGAP